MSYAPQLIDRARDTLKQKWGDSRLRRSYPVLGGYMRERGQWINNRNSFRLMFQKSNLAKAALTYKDSFQISFFSPGVKSLNRI